MSVGIIMMFEELFPKKVIIKYFNICLGFYGQWGVYLNEFCCRHLFYDCHNVKFRIW